MSDPVELLRRRRDLIIALLALLLAAMVPYFPFVDTPLLDDSVTALAYVVMALGLNIVVGFAGLLDLGYVAFFAVGAYTMGWLGSGFFHEVNGGEGIHFGASDFAAELPGIHVSFLVVVVAAVVLTAIAGALIGIPTLRLRGDYIAIVTLAFGEIIHTLAVNEPKVAGTALTAGRQGITPIDEIQLPGTDTFNRLEPENWYWTALVIVAIVLFVNFRLRDSRLGRAWIAIREDEVAAASMGVPLVRTKLAAYATGAAFGGISGAFLGSYLNWSALTVFR